MYNCCDKQNVPYKKVGKLVVAREDQRPYIEGLHAKARGLRWPPQSLPNQHDTPVLPTELISGDRARELEPDLSKDIVAALWSPETGIVDSHSLMDSLEKDIADSEGGEVAYRTRVVRVDPYAAETSSTAPNSEEGGWVVQTVTGESDGESDALLAGTVINCSGLSAHLILNALLPKASRIPMYYGRGSYASYKGPGVEHVSHLIYPCPDTGRTIHGFQSLGTHLTLDLQGKIRFGPDLDWLDPPSASQSDDNVVYDTDPDFWAKQLIPDDTRLGMMHQAVKDYLPEVTLEGLQPDYCGIRPKLVGPQGGFRDFEFYTHYPETFLGPQAQGKSRRPMITLLGIESPGLTSSLAIAEKVVDDMLCEENGHVPG